MDNFIKACEKRIHWINLHSFTGNFEYYKDIFEGELVAKVREDRKGMDKFIEICNNRIERAKTFLQDVATVLGFFGSSLAIVLTLSVLERKETHVDTFLDFISQYGALFPILVFLLIGCVIILFLLLLHYRTSIHAWTAFKEMAILNKKCHERKE